MENPAEKKYLRWWHKGAYGLGLTANQDLNGLLNTFLLLYLTSTAGMNSAIVGTVILVCQFANGVSDVFCGWLIDRTHSKIGKARPWLFASIIPTVVCMVLLFSVPSVSPAAQYVYVGVLYVLMYAVFMTMSNVSVNTMLALITVNPNERVNANAVGFIFAAGLQVVEASIMTWMVNAFGGGAVGWRMAALVFALFFGLLLLVCAIFCKEIPEEERRTADDTSAKAGSLPFLKTLKYVVTNKYFWIMLMAMLFWAMFSATLTGSSSYYAIYTLGKSGWIGLISFGTFIPVLITLLFVSAIVKKVGMYRTISVSMMISAIISVVLAIVGGVGGAAVGALIMVLHVSRGFFNGPFAGLQQTIMADVASYSLLKDNVHIEGAIFSCTSLAAKIGSGLGTWLIGIFIAVSGYQSGTEIQTAAAKQGLNLIFVIIPSVMIVLCAIFVHFLRVDKIQKSLAAGKILEE